MDVPFHIGQLSKYSIRGLVFAALLLVAACASVPPVQVGEFRTGANAVKVQLDTTFAAVNKLASEDAIDRAATLPNLTEDELEPVLKREDIARWDAAFAAIDEYAANLNLLLSPEHATDFGTATEGLGTALNSLDLNISPGIATGFAELGRLLITAKAELDAIGAARIADPGMQQIFSAMAEAIGESNDRGIRGTVWAHWTDIRMANKKLEFLEAGETARRSTVVAFVELRDQRDAQDLQLGSLRQSLLNLATAHHALAEGSNIDLATAISRIQQELAATRALHEHFTSLQPNP